MKEYTVILDYGFKRSELSEKDSMRPSHFWDLDEPLSVWIDDARQSNGYSAVTISAVPGLIMMCGYVNTEENFKYSKFGKPFLEFETQQLYDRFIAKFSHYVHLGFDLDQLDLFINLKNKSIEEMNRLYLYLRDGGHFNISEECWNKMPAWERGATNKGTRILTYNYYSENIEIELLQNCSFTPIIVIISKNGEFIHGIKFFNEEDMKQVRFDIKFFENIDI